MWCRYCNSLSVWIESCLIEEPLKICFITWRRRFHTGVANVLFTPANTMRSMQRSASASWLRLLTCFSVIFDRTALAVDPLVDSECLWNGSSLAAGVGSGRKVRFTTVLTNQPTNQLTKVKSQHQAWANYGPRAHMRPLKGFNPARWTWKKLY